MRLETRSHNSRCLAIYRLLCIDDDDMGTLCGAFALRSALTSDIHQLTPSHADPCENNVYENEKGIPASVNVTLIFCRNG